MDPREAYQATVPQPAVIQPAYAPPPPAPVRWSATAIVIVIAVLLAGVGIGLAIGHSASPSAAPAAASELGHLAVTSTPVDANVLVDGRFAGVAPIERLDLDAGKHSVVIDAFGFQPYSGTLLIEARGKLNLSVLLAPLGTTGATSGSFSGAGKATRAIVPPSALLPAPATAVAPAAPTAPPAPDAKRPAHHAEPSAPSPPRRDCDGEKSRCTDNCRSASTDCDFSCPGCSSCNTSVGWDECKRQCDTCRGSCANNTKFCESSCDTQRQNCEASQR